MSTKSNQSYFSTAGFLRYPYLLVKPVYERTAFHRGVIDELQSQELREAYAHCRFITQTHAKTFYMATRFLPNHKQRSIFAIYALCRYVDDLVDETNDLIQQEKVNPSRLKELLDEWQFKLNRAYDTGQADNPILIAFADTLRTFHIPRKYPMELMEGVCMDLTKNRYSNFDELWNYSYKVASVVGLMTSEVFGYTDEEAIPRAIDLGIAMQLTNILRDIGEDLRRDRIYIPSEDLRAFNLSENDLFNRVKDERFTALMTFQINRARDYYNRADEGIEMLNQDSRLPVYLARHNYSRILDRIEQNRFEVYDKRAHLTAAQKLAILPRAWVSAML
ncbi:MAG: squalene/phytoene synthase family protein [Bacteroidetes bacterium]|nr:squalene/phytoene synthase family protein [Bacteroidota bacterium]MCH8523856.1 squalene/phytoene synthase family protein [Balneolales bacterium]